MKPLNLENRLFYFHSFASYLSLNGMPSKIEIRLAERNNYNTPSHCKAMTILIVLNLTEPC